MNLGVVVVAVRARQHPLAGQRDAGRLHLALDGGVLGHQDLHRRRAKQPVRQL